MPEAAGRAASSPLVGGAAEPTLRELSAPARRAWSLAPLDVPEAPALPQATGAPPALPELSERDLVAHYTRLAHRNFAVDLGAYPLGSCTMKYNPKVCDWAAEHGGFRDLHPATPAHLAQGDSSRCSSRRKTSCVASPGWRPPRSSLLLALQVSHRPLDHGGVSPCTRAQPAHRPHSRFGSRHQPGIRHTRRVPRPSHSERCPRHGRCRRAADCGRRRHRRADADQPEHARPVRRGRRRDRRDRSRHRWPRVLRRGQSQRNPRSGSPRATWDSTSFIRISTRPSPRPTGAAAPVPVPLRSSNTSPLSSRVQFPAAPPTACAG